MIRTILSIVHRISSIFTERNNLVSVDVQPTIFVSKIKECSNITFLQINTLMGLFKYTNTTLSLEFTIKYSNQIINIGVRSDPRLNLETDILLTKYFKKKSHDEIYKDKMHKPKHVILPREGKDDVYGFHISIAKGVENIDFGNVKKCCQIISLYTTNDDTLMNITPSLIEYSIRKFRCLLRIKSEEEPENVAFQFSIKTAASNLSLMDGPPQIVFTNLFEVVFAEDYSTVSIKFVDFKDYHYTPRVPN